jgi:hypothetical protein
LASFARLENEPNRPKFPSNKDLTIVQRLGNWVRSARFVVSRPIRRDHRGDLATAAGRGFA